MRRVSSVVRVRADPAGVSLPLISTSGGFPGVKNRSLIFSEVFSIAASSAGVENGAAAGAAATAAPTAAAAGRATVGTGTVEVGFGAPFAEEDIKKCVLSSTLLAVFSRPCSAELRTLKWMRTSQAAQRITTLEPTRRVRDREDYRRYNLPTGHIEETEKGHTLHTNSARFIPSPWTFPLPCSKMQSLPR